VVKIMLDGVAENFTAAMTEPYLDRCGHGTGNTGLSFVDAGALRSHVAELERAGFAVHLHALGDRAVRDGLDAIAAARAEHAPPRRHHLAHLQVVHPDDVPRFAALGATANLQMLWAVHEPQMDELTIPFLGERRSGWQYPFGDLARSRARLAAGSDWPVSDPDPLAAIHVGVNRALYGERADPFLPGQALDLATALTAYTAGSAYVNHLDAPLHRTPRRDQGIHGAGGPGRAPSGRIHPGAAADLAVLDRDPFAHPADEIGATRVVATYLDGRLVAGGT
jgi:hypothetical protein